MGYKEKNDSRAKISRKKWYNQNKKRQIDNQLRRREFLLRFIDRYKRLLKCTDCSMSFKDRPECCDFHHLDQNEKRGGIAELVRCSIKAVKKEIRKCVPLCANCHRTRHKNTSVV